MADNFDLDRMKDAISQAEQCRPIASKIPKVGAIIAVEGVIVGSGQRGTEAQDDDDHAEKKALSTVHDRAQLSKATVYTTLEPCTGFVRSDPLNCCTELLCQAGVKKVLIGILDPNQGVTGKGLWELQSRGIEVELFPPDLAKEIRSLNSAFIKEQKALGIVIANTRDGQTITTHQNQGRYILEGTYINPPGADVFVMTRIGSRWWPQPYTLVLKEGNTWSTTIPGRRCGCHIGSYEPHTIAVVRASELGAALIEYYRTITAHNATRKDLLSKYATDNSLDVNQILQLNGQLYPGIDMARLPKGLQLLAQVSVLIEQPPK